jgi:hypothetical protein
MRLSRDPDSHGGLGCIVGILILGPGVPIATLSVNPRTVLLSAAVFTSEISQVTGGSIALAVHVASAKWPILAGVVLGGAVCVYTIWDVTRR